MFECSYQPGSLEIWGVHNGLISHFTGLSICDESDSFDYCSLIRSFKPLKLKAYHKTSTIKQFQVQTAATDSADDDHLHRTIPSSLQRFLHISVSRISNFHGSVQSEH